AMACGCLVVASDTPPVREVIDPGRDGLLFDFHDIDAQAALLLDALDQPERHRPLRAAAAERVRLGYSIAQGNAQWAALLQRLTRDHRFRHP
ncbi:MAG: hypothetical protein RLZZ524_2573, partial [Pseudomonadota bacterium]